jgi:hypothetical protein
MASAAKVVRIRTPELRPELREFLDSVIVPGLVRKLHEKNTLHKNNKRVNTARDDDAA